MGPSQSRFIESASWLLRLPLETPTIPFEDEVTGCTLWLKLDYLLPSGCTKDRMATNIGACNRQRRCNAFNHCRRSVKRVDLDCIEHGLRHGRCAFSGLYAQDGQRGTSVDDPSARW